MKEGQVSARLIMYYEVRGRWFWLEYYEVRGRWFWIEYVQ